MNDPVLAVKDLSIRIASRPIIRNASFVLESKASLALIGPNGSGKTLLLKALMGLFPHSGSVHWKTGTRLGYVPQNPAADPHLPLRVCELLRAKAGVQHLAASDIEAAVRWTGIDDLFDQRLGTLSSGQLQRVLIAFALAGVPNVLLIDEPTSSLDELAEQHFFELINKTRLEFGTTVVLVSHDVTLVRDFATHVLCLGGGIASFGTAREMLLPEILERVYHTPVQFHSHGLEQT